MPASYLRIPSCIGHSAGGSAFASALCTATCTIFGVNLSVLTPATSIRPASASPIRSSSQARSAAQSTGLTSRGARTLASSASRSAICAQREANGVSIRRISVDRNVPLASPHGALPSPSWVGSSTPTVHTSRLAQPGYSIGGGGGGRVSAPPSSTALSSGPVATVAVEGVAAGEGCPTVGPIERLGYWFAGRAGCTVAGCWASAGSATMATAAEATSRGLMRITLRDIDFDCVRRFRFRQSLKEKQTTENEHEHEYQNGKFWHGRRFCRAS